MKTIDQLTAEDFAPYIGKACRSAGVDLELNLAAIDRPEQPGWEAVSRKPFALILRGPRDPILAEGSHRLAIENGPTLVLYVIPIFTPSRDHQDYQIIFN